MTVLLVKIRSNQISETQLQVLLGYAEEDIYDQSRQATAFGLLTVSKEAKTTPPLPNLCVYVLCVWTTARRSCPGSSSSRRWRR